MDIRMLDSPGGFDLALSAGDLATDEGLATAISCSLFTDAEARPGDPLPDDGDGRRGWFGDARARVAGDRIGSRLWLLARETITDATLARARVYGTEALAWLVEDGVAASATFDVWRDLRDNVWTVRARAVVLRQGGDPLALGFDDLWARIAVDEPDRI